MATINSSTGVLTAVAQGATTITARVGPFRATATVLVSAPILSSIAVTPNTNPTVPKGASQQFIATGTLSDSSTQDITATASWSSTNNGVATVNAFGLATSAANSGTTSIIASFGGKSGSAMLTAGAPVLASIEVVPAHTALAKGLSQQYYATGHFTDNTTQDLTGSVVWASSSALASITGGGLAGALNVGGPVTISATSGLIQGSTDLTVSPAVPASLMVTPLSATIPLYPVGSSQPFTANAILTDGTLANVTASSIWTSTNTAAAVAGPTGVASPVAGGDTTIVATLGALSASASLTVTAPPAPQLLYVSEFGDSSVSMYQVDAATGHLERKSFLPNLAGANSVAVAPAGTFAFVAGFNANTAYSTRIDLGTATLQFADSKSINSASSVAVSPNGKVLLATSRGPGLLFSYTIDTSGVLTQVSVPGTGTGPESVTIDPSGRFAYVANRSSNDIYAYALNSTTGVLSPIASYPSGAPGPPPGAAPEYVTVDPAGKFLYAANFGENTITSYQIDPSTGALSGQVDFPAGASPFSIAVDPSGLYAYAANFGSGTISVYAVDRNTGALNPLPPAAAGSNPRSVQVDPSGKFVYVTDQTANQIYVYSLNRATGGLTLLESDLTRNTPVSIAFRRAAAPVQPVPQFLYAANFFSSNVSGYSIDPSTGALTELSGQGSPFPTGFEPDSVAVEPRQQLAFAVNNHPASSNVSVYGLDPGTGGLTPVFNSPVAAGSGAHSIAVDPSGSFAYVTNFSADNIYEYRAGTTFLSGLSFMAAFSTASRPRGITVDRLGKFVYVANYANNTVSAYTINPSTGALSATVPPTFPTGADPYDVAVHPSGRYLYVPNQIGASVSGFAIDPSSGNLLPLGTFAAGNGSLAITISRDGKHVYVANAFDNSLSIYSVNLANGTLSQIATSPTFTGVQPEAVAVDDSGRFLYVANTNDNAIAAFNRDPATGAINALPTSPFPAGTFPTSLTTVSSLQPVTAQLVSLTLGPASPSLAKGQSLQLSAIGTFSDGSSHDLTSVTSWSSADATVVTVNDTGSKGLATAVNQGRTTARGSYLGFSATTEVTVGAPALTSISVSPPTSALVKGLTEQFSATGTFSDGSTQDLTSQVTWMSSNNGLATINSSGLATGTGVGTATVTASFGAATTATALLTVTPAALVSLDVTPANPTINTGAAQQFIATGHYTDGSTQVLTSSVTWDTSDVNVATISNTGGSQGMATGAGAGSAGIVAYLSGVQGSAALQVGVSLVSIAVTPGNSSLARGTSQQYTAMGTFSDNSIQNITNSLTWGSSNSAIASITNPGGFATGNLAGGPVTITASSSGKIGTASLTVNAPSLVSIAVTPASPSVAKGLTQPFTATGTFTDNSTGPVAGVVWSSSDSGKVSINPATGLATAADLGSPAITATASGKSGSTIMTVTPATLVSVAVTPANPSIPKGTAQQFTATGTFTDASTQNLTSTASWNSNNTGVATVTSPGGLATGVAQGGPVTITATSGGIGGNTGLTVGAAALSTITVTPANPVIQAPGGATTSQQFSATGTYTDATTQNLTSLASWNSSNMGVATITSPGGLASSVANGGPISITAMYQSKQGQTSLTVSTQTLVSISISPAKGLISNGSTQQYTAIGHYNDGSSKDITGSVTWASTNTGVATITSPGGLATGKGAGGTLITATLGPITSPQATLTVQ